MHRFKAADKVLLNGRTFTIAVALTDLGSDYYELVELPGYFAEHLFKRAPKSMEPSLFPAGDAHA